MSEFSVSPPLTLFSEDEKLFYDMVTDFAKDKIKPLVREMDDASTIDPSIIPQLFELGLMG